MSFVDEIDTSSVDVQLTYLVGRIARAAVQFEDEVDRLFGLLVGDLAKAEVLRERSNEAAVRRCKGLVRAMQPSHALQDEILAALDAGRMAYSERNKFIHFQMYVEGDGSVARWPRGGKSMRVSLADVQKVRESMVAAAWRVTAARHVLMGLEQDWVGVLRGRFDVISGDAISFVEPE